MLGYTLVGLGRSEDAAGHLEEYLKLAPDGPFAPEGRVFVAQIRSERHVRAAS